MVKDFYIYSLSLAIFVKIHRINIRNLLITNNIDERLKSPTIQNKPLSKEKPFLIDGTITSQFSSCNTLIQKRRAINVPRNKK